MRQIMLICRALAWAAVVVMLVLGRTAWGAPR